MSILLTAEKQRRRLHLPRSLLTTRKPRKDSGKPSDWPRTSWRSWTSRRAWTRWSSVLRQPFREPRDANAIFICGITLTRWAFRLFFSKNWHILNCQVVISDIDGTITKSDVLGHLLPVIGRDWAQSGVAHLYTKIRNNGYQIIYLSARAIGQASVTKDYLQSLKQGDVCLPDGPLFLNPDSLIHAFKREVIDRNPEEFKIRCLKDIQSLFNGKNPFFAGYGNRPNVRINCPNKI